MKKIFLWVLIIILSVAALFSAYIVYDNSRIVNTTYQYVSDKVPSNFDGYKIVLITDFHNSEHYQKLADTVKAASPDIICIAGDLVSMNTENFTNTKKLLRELTSITTVYYSYGNHEIWSNTYHDTKTPLVEKEIAGLGVVMLNNKVKTIEKDGQLINLIGYGDSVYDDTGNHFETHAKKTLTSLANTLDKNVLSILLFHRAQYFDMISQLPYDLVLAGHLHGGHVNLPYVRELILQKHFGSDKYRKGEYHLNGSEMIICGGTALKDDLYRLFNTPEIVTVELKCK